MKKWSLSLIFVGRTTDSYVREACKVFQERIRRYAYLNIILVPEERVRAKGKKDYILHREGQRVREKLRPGFFTVALDERGTLFSSEAFAHCLEKWSQGGTKEMAFIVGGPYGLEEDLKAEADFRLSLSSLTLAHGMARMLLLEQIYRAFTLLRGEPYPK